MSPRGYPFPTTGIKPLGPWGPGDTFNLIVTVSSVMPGPTFMSGDDVELRVVEEEDLPFLQRIINDPGVWGALQRVDPATREDERAFYEEVLHTDNHTHLLICNTDGPVGIVGLNRVDPNWGVAELGYFVDPAAAGNGYATEGVALMLDYAFDHRRLEKLVAYILAGNPGSRRVVEKNGFEEEGHLREHAYADGKRQDVYVYGLLNRERS